MTLTRNIEHTGLLLREAADFATDLGAGSAAVVVHLAGDAAERVSHAAHAIPEAASAVSERASKVAKRASDLGERASESTGRALRRHPKRSVSTRDAILAAVAACVVVAVAVALWRRLRTQPEPDLELA